MILLYRPKTKNAIKVLQWTGDNKDEVRGFCGNYVTFLMLQSKDGTKTKEICVLKPSSIVWENNYIIRDGRGYFMSCLAYGYGVHGRGSNGLVAKINYCPICGKSLKKVE